MILLAAEAFDELDDQNGSPVNVALRLGIERVHIYIFLPYLFHVESADESQMLKLAQLMGKEKVELAYDYFIRFLSFDHDIRVENEDNPYMGKNFRRQSPQLLGPTPAFLQEFLSKLRTRCLNVILNLF